MRDYESVFLEGVFERILKKEDLSREEARRVFSQLFKGEMDEALGFCLFTAFSAKGVSIEEAGGFCDALMDDCTYDFVPDPEKPVINISGTGGDTIKTVNVSSTTFFVAAGAGARMGKHGARRGTSKAGSVDTLECLGINMEASAQVSKRCLDEIGIAYVSAVTAFKWIKYLQEQLPKRKDYPVLLKCIFPAFRAAIMPAFVSPFGASRYLRGIVFPETERVCRLTLGTNIDRAMVVYGKGPKEGDTLDEISNVGETWVTEQRKGEIFSYVLTPKDFGLPLSRPEEIKGGDSPQEQARYLVNILKGEDRGPRRALILMNVSVVLYLADMVSDFKKGVEMAQESIDGGRALEKLKLLVQKGGGDVSKLESYLYAD